MTTDEGRPTGYDELLRVIAVLPDLVREKRRREGLSLRKAEEQTGLSFSTIDRFERRTAISSADTLVALLHWVSS